MSIKKYTMTDIETRWNPEVGDTGNILPIVQSNGLMNTRKIINILCYIFLILTA